MALGMTVGEMMRRMSCQDYDLWLAYTSVEPIGERRADMRAAMQANVTAAAGGMKTKYADFLPDYWQAPKPKRTAVDIMGFFLHLTKAMRGKVIGKADK